MKALTSGLAVLFPFDAGVALASSESLRGSSPYADSPVPKLKLGWVLNNTCAAYRAA